MTYSYQIRRRILTWMWKYLRVAPLKRGLAKIINQIQGQVVHNSIKSKAKIQMDF